MELVSAVMMSVELDSSSQLMSFGIGMYFSWTSDNDHDI